MSLPPISETKAPATRRDLRIVWLGGAVPCLWFALLLGLYALSDHECGARSAWRSWIVWAAGSAISGWVFAHCLRESRAFGSARKGQPNQRARIRFMFDVGLGLGLLSLTLLVGFAFPLALLRPCE